MAKVIHFQATIKSWETKTSRSGIYISIKLSSGHSMFISEKPWKKVIRFLLASQLEGLLPVPEEVNDALELLKKFRVPLSFRYQITWGEGEDPHTNISLVNLESNNGNVL